MDLTDVFRWKLRALKLNAHICLRPASLDREIKDLSAFNLCLLADSGTLMNINKHKSPSFICSYLLAAVSAAPTGLSAFLHVADAVAAVSAKLAHFGALSTNTLVLRRADEHQMRGRETHLPACDAFDQDQCRIAGTPRLISQILKTADLRGDRRCNETLGRHNENERY